MSKTIEEMLAAAAPHETHVGTDAAVAGLGTDIQKHIGNLLKASFQDVLTEPVPERFSQLLEQLEQAENDTPKTNKGS